MLGFVASLALPRLAHAATPATTAAAGGDAGGAIPLRISDRTPNQLEVSWPDGPPTAATAASAVAEVRTTGRDPFLYAARPDGKPIDPASVAVLSFEYFSQTGTGPVEVFADPIGTPVASATGPKLTIAQGWVAYAMDARLALAGGGGGAGKTIRGVRIDLGNRADRTVRLRNLVLRPQSDAERKADAERQAKRDADAGLDATLSAYLSATFPAAVSAVRVDAKQVRIEGTIGAKADFGGAVLAELPLWADSANLGAAVGRTPLAVGNDGRFAVSLDRLATLDGKPHDRLLSRWVVARAKTAEGNASGGGATSLVRLSADRWADEVAAPADAPPAAKPKSKKGLGGFHAGRLDADMDELGISAVTVNVMLSAIMRESGGPGRTPFEFAGRTWWADDGAVAGYDATMLAAAKRGAVVSAIILVTQGRNAPAGSYAHIVAHPDADPSGIFAMPNVASRGGCEAYAAGLEFLARRYSRPDGKYGRVHHYILHNEVDAGWVWTNAGEKSARTYLELYHRSMRTAHLIARQYDPGAKAFISLTHHWAAQGEARWYGSRRLLELLLDFSHAEGDFDWAIAFHPYPQSLGDPRVWENDQATFSPESPKVTFKNLEVLDAWAKQPAAMFQGTRVRTIHLTEQGLNSKDYSEASLRDQAAGMAYAWAKVQALDSIEAFQYHNWIDNRGEGGLRIGLRRFPDDTDAPLGPKPIWHLYEALGTPGEAAAMAPYLSVVGLKSWDEVPRKQPVP